MHFWIDQSGYNHQQIQLHRHRSHRIHWAHQDMPRRDDGLLLREGVSRMELQLKLWQGWNGIEVAMLVPLHHQQEWWVLNGEALYASTRFEHLNLSIEYDQITDLNSLKNVRLMLGRH